MRWSYHPNMYSDDYKVFTLNSNAAHFHKLPHFTNILILVLFSRNLNGYVWHADSIRYTHTEKEGKLFDALIQRNLIAWFSFHKGKPHKHLYMCIIFLRFFFDQIFVPQNIKCIYTNKRNLYKYNLNNLVYCVYW